MRIAFDVDETLITTSAHGDTIPNFKVLQILHNLYDLGCDIYVWSGGGIDYAELWARRLGLWGMVSIIPKDGNFNMDICFDDMEVNLAKVNIKV